ncbi:hypothetical protein ACFTQ7_04155 [Lysinibacillus sp. NPDC056959]|uniref:hypothetical protein n=1 Tax=Lysinibacillus sp. NPDC056959 TaxID=3345981 RepID=UPI00363397F3
MFNINISDITHFISPHYHLTRYRDIADRDDLEIIHESIAVNLEQGYWEIYYQDGNLEEINEKSGSLKDYGKFLFTVTLKEEDDIQTSLESSFDTWLQNNS